MIRFVLLMILLLFPVSGNTASVGPAEFEQIWLLNNQRNIIARYQQRTEQFRQGLDVLYRLDIDSTSNQTIRTSVGEMDAIMDRIGLHYQSASYLFMLDWLSLIPQPQTTEGFTYGDMVLGRSWQAGDKLNLTLGLRMQSTPNSRIVAGETVFDLSNNATSEAFGGFAHVNYGDWDLGTYYSGRDGNQANSLKYVILDTGARTLDTTLTNLQGAPERNIAARNEFALNLKELIAEHELRASITAASPVGGGNTRVSNAYLLYQTPEYVSFRFSAGLFHTYLLDTDETFFGEKLGFEYLLTAKDGTFSMGIYGRRNAFGDIDAMVVRDQPVYSFMMFWRSK